MGRYAGAIVGTQIFSFMIMSKSATMGMEISDAACQGFASTPMARNAMSQQYV
jgi:hypothetical protein